MTTVVPTLKTSEIVYPSADREPVAETYDHVYQETGSKAPSL
ncbi:hypothetical protein QUB16_13725 [Microcoleus sp. D3_18a_C4]